MTPADDRSILRFRDFTIYVVGGWLSNSGTWLQNIVASVLMLQVTGSVFMVGMLNFATFLPILLFSLIGGVISDSYRVRTVVISTHVLAMTVTVGLAALTLAGRTEPWHLMGAAFVINSGFALSKPAMTSLLPELVPRHRLAEATAINSLQFTGGQMLGSALAAATLYVGTAGWGFALNAVTFLGPIAGMLLIRASARQAPDAPTEGGRHALLEGLRYIRADPLILLLMTGIGMASITTEVMRTLSPEFATGVLDEDESATGILIGCFAAGWAATVLLMPRVLRRLPQVNVSVAGFGVQAAGVVTLAAAPSLPIAVLGTTLIGVGFCLNLTMLTARLLQHAPDRLRGRVMSMHTIANLGSRPIAALAAGALAAVLGARLAMLACVLVAGVGIATAIRTSRRSAA